MKCLLAATFVLINLTALNAYGETNSGSTHVYGDGEKPADARLGELKDLNGYFPMQVPTSLDEWKSRSEQVRRRILVSCGLWPMPERPEVKPVIHGLVERDEYTVERVYFEGYPGLYVTGSLYRPRNKQGPFPVVLSPHGHFNNGRFYDHGEEEVIRQIKMGAERFEVSGRYPLQARCVQLARMGCIVFHYDMLGYADSNQISYELAHRHRSPREGLEDPAAWGLFTAQAEMRLQNVFGLQTFNSLRAVDFVVQLPDVDASRIAVTGASGGGTQTMMLAALEPRVAVSFPAVMVSTAMQGGCTCENATCLRVGTGNIEFAGLFAPKPMGITTADDWTVEVKTKGYPELQKLYALHQSKSHVKVFPERELYWPHNFNFVSRNAMYEWMNEHLKLGVPNDFLEQDFEPLSIDELTVWNDQHPTPPGGEEFETSFLRSLSNASDQQLLKAAKSPGEFRKVARQALKTLLATSYDEIGDVTPDPNRGKFDEGDYYRFPEKISWSEDGRQHELPVLMLHPKEWNKEIVIWTSGRGKRSLADANGKYRKEVMTLLQKGYSIVAPDLFQQGEFLSDPLQQTRKVGSDRDFAGYTFGYNRTLIGHRVHDLLAMIKMIDTDEHGTQKVHVLGIEGAGPYAILTAALAGKHIDRLAIDDGDFRFRDIKSWRDPDFLPGAIKYGDLPAMLGLSRAGEMWVGTKNVSKARADMQPFQNLDGKPEFATAEQPVSAAIQWLVR